MELARQTLRDHIIDAPLAPSAQLLSSFAVTGVLRIAGGASRRSHRSGESAWRASCWRVGARSARKILGTGQLSRICGPASAIVASFAIVSGNASSRSNGRWV